MKLLYGILIAKALHGGKANWLKLITEINNHYN